MDTYQSLREEAFQANMEIPAQNLAIYTWGNVSAFDPDAGVFAIKPSGVLYRDLKPDSLVVVDLDGKTVWGSLRPSSDTETHRVLYRAFPGIRGLCHTHSTFAAAWAQAGRSVPVLGTTHADHAAVEIPCTGFLNEAAAATDYERETGNLIVETFRERGINPAHIQMALVAGHGPFTWGADAAEAVYHAAALEEICKMAWITLCLDPDTPPLPPHIITTHWQRKHGLTAYYGQ